MTNARRKRRARTKFSANGGEAGAPFKFAYSPVPDATVSETGVGGVLGTVAETTEYVYAERQLRTLRELAARTAEASTPEQACGTAAATFEGNPADVPFASYLLAADGKSALVAASGFIADDGVANRRTIDLDATPAESGWPLSRIASTGAVEVITDLQARFGDLPKGKPRTNFWRCSGTSFEIRCRSGAHGASGLEPAHERGQVQRAGLEIVIAATREGDRVRICVKDEGVGIAPELLGSVFERFVQQPQTLARSKGGLGLGLAIVRSLVELHGGSVRAESEGVGKGAEFVLDFPAVELSPPDADRVAPPDPVVPLARRSKRIQQADKQRSEAAGFEKHLVKPIDLNKLERVVEELSS